MTNVNSSPPSPRSPIRCCRPGCSRRAGAASASSTTCEIDARRLRLYSSLFDYTVRELRYTEAGGVSRRCACVARAAAGRLAEPEQRRPVAELLRRWDRSGGGPGAVASAGARRRMREQPAPAPCRCWMRTDPAAARGARDEQEHAASTTDAGRGGSRGGGPRRAAAAAGGRTLAAVAGAAVARGSAPVAGWCGREWSGTIRADLHAGSGGSPTLPVTGVRRRQREGSRQIALRRPRGTRAGPGSPRRTTSGRSGPRSRRQPALRAGGGAAEASPKRGHGPLPGSRTSAPKCVAPRAERAGSAGDAVATEPTSAPKARAAAGSSIAELTSAAKPRVAAGSSIQSPTARDRRSRLRRRSLVWPAARDRPRRLWRRSQENRPADRFRLRSGATGAIRAAAATSTGIPGGAAARASSWSWTTSCRSRAAAARSRQT